jgi:hypothetical protein
LKRIEKDAGLAKIMMSQVEIMDIKTYYDSGRAELIRSRTRTYDIVHKLNSKNCSNRDKVVPEIRDTISSLKRSMRAYAEFFSTSTYFLENHFYNKIKNVYPYKGKELL